MGITKYGEKGKEKYQIRGRLYDAQGNFVKAYRKIGFDTKREAKAYEDNLLATTSSSEFLFKDLVKHYLAYYKTENKYTSYISTKNAIELYIIPIFSDRDIFSITPKNVLEWKMDMITKGFSIGYLNKIRVQLVAIFNHAKKYFHLEKNPCDNMGMFKSKELKKEMLFWTYDEFKKFIEKADDEFYKLMFITLFKTGLRKGELQALQWKDFKNDTLDVSKTWARLDVGYFDLSSPKTPNSYRTIKIDIEVLKGLKTRLKTVNKTIGFNDEFFIFGDTSPISASQIDRMFTRYIKQSNVKRIRIHDLRHSHASYLISLGANIVMVSNRLGHASTQETLDTYGHMYPNQEDAIIKKMKMCQKCVNEK